MIQPITTPVSSDSGESCAFCLEAVLLRGGGIPLYTPGCCGKFFHQKCIVDYVNTVLHNSAAKCPSCRSSFEVPPWMRFAQNNPPNPPRGNPFALTNAGPSFGIAVPSFGAGAGFAVPVAPTNAPFTFGATMPLPTTGGFVPRFGSQSNTGFVGEITEELLTEVLKTPTDVSATRQQNITDLQSSISISATPEYNIIGLGAKDAFYVRVGIHYQERLAATAPIVTPEVGNPSAGAGITVTAKDAAVTPFSTVALDIVCVLDNSGSMNGSKLANLKSAMNFVIQSLGPNDRLSVCSFNQQAENLHGLLRMNDENKTKSANIIRDHLNAGGGTKILSGMRRGAEILQTRRTRNTASCLFLLTDGQDRSCKEQKIDLARSLKDSGTTLFVFGFGTDHDAEHMMEISQAAEGGFSYIDTDDTVADAFGGALGSLKGNILLTNLNLRISSAVAEVQIKHAAAGRYTTSIDSSNTVATVTIANMFCGEKRDVLLQLSVPQVPHPCFSSLLSASLQYSAFDETHIYPPSTSSVAGGITCGVERVDDGDERLQSQVRALEVDEQINRLAVTTATGSAMRAADRGDMAEARRILNEAIAKVTSSPSFTANTVAATGLLQELRDAVNSTVSRDYYDRGGGKNAMCESFTSTAQQRSLYTKAGKTNMYQSTSSTGYQYDFNTRKGGW